MECTELFIGNIRFIGYFQDNRQPASVVTRFICTRRGREITYAHVCSSMTECVAHATRLYRTSLSGVNHVLPVSFFVPGSTSTARGSRRPSPSSVWRSAVLAAGGRATEMTTHLHRSRSLCTTPPTPHGTTVNAAAHHTEQPYTQLFVYAVQAVFEIVFRVILQKNSFFRLKVHCLVDVTQVREQNRRRTYSVYPSPERVPVSPESGRLKSSTSAGSIHFVNDNILHVSQWVIIQRWIRQRKRIRVKRSPRPYNALKRYVRNETRVQNIAHGRRAGPFRRRRLLSYALKRLSRVRTC